MCCLICAEWNLGKLKIDEALKNAYEMPMSNPHTQEVFELLAPYTYQLEDEDEDYHNTDDMS